MSHIARRLFAGAWFAFLAVIPVAFYFLFFWRKTEHQQGAIFFWVFIGLPIFLAGICGWVFGSSILDPEKIRTSKQAMLRGLLVAVLAFALFFPIAGLIIGLTSEDPAEALNGWAGIILLGTILVGWLIALTGAMGGALLYLYRVMSARDKGIKAR